jgi:hypothetical protein
VQEQTLQITNIQCSVERLPKQAGMQWQIHQLKRFNNFFHQVQRFDSPWQITKVNFIF